jgi:asparagine synthase (glutamine-hydrolysing)
LGPLRSTVGQGADLLGHISDSRVLKKYAPLMNVPLDEHYLSRSSSPYQYFNKIPSALYSAELSRSVNKCQSSDVTRNLLSGKLGYGPLEKMQYLDIKTYLPDDLLIKADRMTMANSIELRVPFLDPKVLEFAARLPRHQKVRGWKMKYLLKKALAEHVPKQILDRRKVGFPNPSTGWLRHDLKDLVADTLLDSKSLSRGYFRREAIEGLIELNARSGRYTAEIFSLVVLELWHRTFIDRLETQMSVMPAAYSPRVSNSSSQPTAAI